MTLSEIIKKISLRKGISEKDIELMYSNLFKQIKDEMGKSELNKIMIHNFLTFIPDRKKMLRKKKMCEYMINNGKGSERILELKDTIEKNINKQFKSKRCH